MGNQQTNEIYKQYFNPQPTPLMNINYQPCYHQLRLATQEEPIEEEESRDDEDAMYRDQMFLQQMKGSFHENIMIDADDMQSSINYNQSLIHQDISTNLIQKSLL
eukprot:403347076